MVVVLDADKALYGGDFRAENLSPANASVSGRAGRDGGENRVYIQTFHVDHQFGRVYFIGIEKVL